MMIRKNVTKEWLLNNGFKYNKTLSYNDEDVYTYRRFPVYKNGNYTVLECEINYFDMSNEFKVDVYEYGTKYIYVPFYCIEYGNYKMILKIIHKRIEYELKKLGLKNK